MYDKQIPLSNSSLLLNSILINEYYLNNFDTIDEKLNKKRNMVDNSIILLFFMVQNFTT